MKNDINHMSTTTISADSYPIVEINKPCADVHETYNPVAISPDSLNFSTNLEIIVVV